MIVLFLFKKNFLQGGQQWWALWGFSGSLPLCLILLCVCCHFSD